MQMLTLAVAVVAIWQIPSAICALFILRSPASPRYLLSVGNESAARAMLHRMDRVNNGEKRRLIVATGDMAFGEAPNGHEVGVEVYEYC